MHFTIISVVHVMYFRVSGQCIKPIPAPEVISVRPDPRQDYNGERCRDSNSQPPAEIQRVLSSQRPIHTGEMYNINTYDYGNDQLYQSYLNKSKTVNKNKNN